MDRKTGRSILIIVALQSVTALAALLSSPLASLAAAAIGLLAVARYASIAFFAASMGPGPAAKYHVFVASAWILCFLALVVALVAVALKARAVLPWAIAAAFIGPVGMSVQAFGSGLGAIATGRRDATMRRDAARSGGDR
jgi:hypothetical protein